MSWMQKLYDTYERCAGSDLPDAKALLPIAHTTQQAHIEIVIDEKGEFRRALLIPKDQQQTLVPCTEESGGRSGTMPSSHPLCDNLQYVAKDFRDYGGEVTSGFANTPGAPHDDYLGLLQKWARFSTGLVKLDAVLAYVQRGKVVADLVTSGVLPVTDGAPSGVPEVVKEWPRDRGTAPAIFQALGNGQSPTDAFIRWRIESRRELCTGTWEDPALILAWQKFYASRQATGDVCQVTGRTAPLAKQHPKKIRHAGDNAKLISANDKAGFTYRGRFQDAAQAFGVAYDVSQKAHYALRWLIERRQAFVREGDQVFVAWSPAGHKIPDPWADTLKLLTGESDLSAHQLDSIDSTSQAGDVGYEFAQRLRRTLAGYQANLDDGDGVMVLGLDSALPKKGGIAIVYYRELRASDFLARIQAWHVDLAWHQDMGRDRRFVGAPSLRDIVHAAYGPRAEENEKLRKATLERLLPCLIDECAIPYDLVTSCTHRTFARSRPKGEEWEWEKCLGIACALFKGFHKERGYSMALEEDRKTRDYLYGRLLAIAEHLESRALYVARESRDTTAARLFQRFADHPYTTWRTIELSLGPYKSRLRVSRSPFLWTMEELLDEVLGHFSSANEKDAFSNDHPLSGEFLLAYHCQRQALRHVETDDADSSATATAD